jgi:FAD/FMN-containing dehydrogenase
VARGPELLRRWRDVMRDAPEELSLAFAYMTAPADDPDVPEHLRGKLAVVVAGMYAGPAADGERALRPIRELGAADLDAFGPVAYADLQCSLDDPPGYRNYWTAEQLPDLPDAVVDLVHARALEMPGSAPQIFCVAWGGAVARHDRGPLAGRDARFVVHPLMLWDDPADDADVIAWGRAFRATISEHTTGVAYLNFTGDEGAARVRAQYRPGAYERLARIKAEWDPDNVFRAVGSVSPRTSVD